MKDQLELPIILDSIRGAFRPLRCAAEDFDYGQKIRFRVFSDDVRLLKVEETLVRNLREPDRLAFVVGEARRNLSNRGFVLEPWAAPVVSERT
jgi:hypothetical protein